MSKHIINCPTCFSAVSTKDAFHGVVVCKCGEVISARRRGSDEGYSTSFWLVAITITIMAGILHAVNWDNYALEIIPLKVKQTIGSASYQDNIRVAEICQIRKKFNCEETALILAYKLNNKDKSALAKAGELQLKRKAYQQAIVTLANLIKVDKNNQEGRLNLARALTATGKTNDAKKQLNFIVFSKSKEPQVTAAREYVDLLIKSKDYVTAKKVIEHTRTLGNHTALFLEKEYRLVAQRSALGRLAKAP